MATGDFFCNANHGQSTVAMAANSLYCETGWLHDIIKAVYNRWTGLVDWTSGLDYWTDRFSFKMHRDAP